MAIHAEFKGDANHHHPGTLNVMPLSYSHDLVLRKLRDTFPNPE